MILRNRQLRLARRVTFVWPTIPRRTGHQKDLFLYRLLMILASSGLLDQRNRECYKEECFHTPRRRRYHILDRIAEAVIAVTP